MQVIFRMIIMRGMTFYYCSFKRLFAHSQYTYTASGQKTLSASECDNPFLILKMVTNPAINDIIRIGEFFKGGHELKKKIEFDSEKKVFPIKHKKPFLYSAWQYALAQVLQKQWRKRT